MFDFSAPIVHWNRTNDKFLFFFMTFLFIFSHALLLSRFFLLSFSDSIFHDDFNLRNFTLFSSLEHLTLLLHETVFFSQQAGKKKVTIFEEILWKIQRQFYCAIRIFKTWKTFTPKSVLIPYPLSFKFCSTLSLSIPLLLLLVHNYFIYLFPTILTKIRIIFESEWEKSKSKSRSEWKNK